VGQVGNRTVPVLEIEGIEELLSALGADLGKRIAHGESGARVLGHRIGKDFWIGAMDGEDFGLVVCAYRKRRFTGHSCGLANRIRH
jgi:hypothetical protein